MSGSNLPVLPYARQLIEDDDIAAVTHALRGDYLTTGPLVETFEAELAATVGVAEAVSCANGTAALHLTATALGLGSGDVVIVPSITFLATANAARFVGAEVVFADVNPATGLMGPEELEAALQTARGSAAKAVYPVCYAGQCSDRAALALCARHRAVVYDSCHGLGTVYPGGGQVGDAGHAAMEVFSFHAVKTIALGEGGAITTNDKELAARLRRARNHGMVRDPAAFQQRDMAFDADGGANPWYYEMPEPGYNYRLTDIQCALGLSQLRKLQRFAEVRRVLAARYRAALAPLAPAVRSLEQVPGCSPVLHLFPVRIDFPRLGKTRSQVMRELREVGVGTQVHYVPVHLQPYYRQRYGVTHLPGAEAFYASILSLPFFAGMTVADVDRVVDALATVTGRT